MRPPDTHARASVPWAVLASASVVTVALVWMTPYLPTNDGPESVLVTHIVAHYADPGSIFPQLVAPNVPVTSRGFDLLYAPLAELAGWSVALRLYLSALVLAQAWAFVALACAFGRPRPWEGLLGFPLAYSWVLYMGFFSFAAGQALALTLIACAARLPAVPKSTLLVTAGVGAASVIHVSAAIVALPMLVAVLAATGIELKGVARWARPGLPLLAAVPVVVFTFAHRADTRASAEASFDWAPAWSAVQQLPRLAFPGPWWRAASATALWAAAATQLLTRWRRDRLSRVERVMAASACGYLFALCVAPTHIPGWQFVSPRFAAFASLVPLAMLDTSRWKVARRAVGAPAISAVVAIALAGTATLHHKLDRGCREPLEALSTRIQRRGFQLPIVVNPYCGVSPFPHRSDVPYLAPLRHFAALFAVSQGGTLPSLFIGSRAAHHLQARADAPPAPPIPNRKFFEAAFQSVEFWQDPSVQARTMDALVVAGLEYENVILLGAGAALHEPFLRRGYVADFRGSRTLLAHFEGCSARFSLPQANVSLEIGVQTPGTPLWLLREPRADRNDPRLFIVDRLPCGAVAARIKWLGMDRGIATCAESGPDGRLLFELPRGTAVACSLR